MSRGDQLGRQWQIIQTLLSSKRGRSALELSEELECNLRTVYRDLEALQIAGFPICNEREDGKNLWSLLDTVKQSIPIPFTLTELMAIYFSRDLVKTLQDTAFYDSLESLFKKIKTTLPPDSEEFLKNVQNTLYVSQKQYKEYGKAKGTISTVNDAAIRKRSIEINYYSMSNKKESVRKVDPYRILFFNGTFYLIAYCHQRIETRIFALDRIKSVSMTGESFTVPDDFDLEDFMKPSFGIFKGKPEKVRIWFGPNAAGYITEKVWHETQNIIEADDGSIIFEAEIAITEEIKTWVLSWGSKAAVLKPASLKKELKDEIEKMARKY